MIRFVDPLPLWAVGLLTLSLALASFDVGFRLGRRKRETKDDLSFQAGRSHGRSPALVAAAVAFAAVIFVVADLDRPQEGALRVSQQPLIDTSESMTPEP